MPNQDIQRTDNRELYAQIAVWRSARSRLWGGLPRITKKLEVVRIMRIRPVLPVIPLRRIEYVAPIMRGQRKSLKWIALKVATKYQVNAKDLSGPSRLPALVVARHEAFFRCRSEITRNGEPVSLPEIGRFFRRDHTTVIYGIRKHCALNGLAAPC